MAVFIWISANHEAALADLNRAIELNRAKSPSLTTSAAITYLALKNFDAAIADFDRAIKLEPEIAWAYQGRGTALMYKGEMLRAIEEFDRAIELDPKMAWAYFNRGLIWMFLGDESELRKTLPNV